MSIPPILARHRYKGQRLSRNFGVRANCGSKTMVRHHDPQVVTLVRWRWPHPYAEYLEASFGRPWAYKSLSKNPTNEMATFWLGLAKGALSTGNVSRD